MQTLSLEQSLLLVSAEAEDFRSYLISKNDEEGLARFNKLYRNTNVVINGYVSWKEALEQHAKRLGRRYRQRIFGKSSERSKVILDEKGSLSFPEDNSNSKETTKGDSSNIDTKGGNKGTSTPFAKVAKHSVTDEEQEAVVSGKSKKDAERKKRGTKRDLSDLDLESLPTETIHIPEKDLICPHCGARREIIGYETRFELELIPPKLVKRVLQREKAACPCCQGADAMPGQPTQAVITAPNDRIYPYSYFSSSLLAGLIVSKFDDHLPMNRMEEMYRRYGIDFSRSVICDAFLHVSAELRPIYSLLLKDIRQSKLANMDETGVRIKHDEEGKEIKGKRYFWIVYSQTKEGDPQHTTILLSPGKRAEANIVSILGSHWEGFLQTDGYTSYLAYCKHNNDIIHVVCLAHIRRKFVDAIKDYSKEERQNLKDSIPVIVICIIGKIYHAERKFKEEKISGKELTIKRKEIILPLLNELYGVISQGLQKTPQGGPLWNEMNYAMSLKNEMYNYIKCPYFGPDNNSVERIAKTIAVGRHNWLFCHSWKGAEAAALFYSLIETAKKNGLNPFYYLKYLFDKYPAARRHDLARQKKAEEALQKGEMSQQELEACQDVEIRKLLPWNCKDCYNSSA